MTAFEELERGDIVWGIDPLSEKGRPMVVLGTPRGPERDAQLITVLISTTTYHDASLRLRDDSVGTGRGLRQERSQTVVLLNAETGDRVQPSW